MSTELATRPSALRLMADRCNVDPEKLHQTLKNTVFKGASDDEMLALVVTANVYELNPLLKEMYAFPKKGGGITPMVGVDGWLKIANRQPNYDGMTVDVYGDDKNPTHATCEIFLKDRQHSVKITEYFDECKRPTDPWNQMPRRMLRNKAMIQAIRIAFGIGGIHDEDEAADIAERSDMRNVTPPSNPYADPRLVDAPAATTPDPEPAKRARKPKPEPAAATTEAEPAAPAAAPTEDFPPRQDMVTDIKESWREAEITMAAAEAKYKSAGLLGADEKLATLSSARLFEIWKVRGPVLRGEIKPEGAAQ